MSNKGRIPASLTHVSQCHGLNWYSSYFHWIDFCFESSPSLICLRHLLLYVVIRGYLLLFFHSSTTPLCTPLSSGSIWQTNLGTMERIFTELKTGMKDQQQGSAVPKEDNPIVVWAGVKREKGRNTLTSDISWPSMSRDEYKIVIFFTASPNLLVVLSTSLSLSASLSHRTLGLMKTEFDVLSCKSIILDAAEVSSIFI